MIYKSIIVLIISIGIVGIGYLDYQYYNSFYHLLLICGLVNISLIGYFIINKLTHITRIFTKWLGI